VRGRDPAHSCWNTLSGAGFPFRARPLRAPAAYRDGRAFFPVSNKKQEARGASSRLLGWRAHLRKSVVVSTYNRRQPCLQDSLPQLNRRHARGSRARRSRDSVRRLHRARSTGRHRDQVPDRGPAPGQPATVIRHQLGQSASRRVLSGRSLELRIDIIDTRTLLQAASRWPGRFQSVVLRANGTVNNDKIRNPMASLRTAGGSMPRRRQHAQGVRSRCPYRVCSQRDGPSGVPADNRLMKWR